MEQINFTRDLFFLTEYEIEIEPMSETHSMSNFFLKLNFRADFPYVMVTEVVMLVNCTV